MLYTWKLYTFTLSSLYIESCIFFAENPKITFALRMSQMQQHSNQYLRKECHIILWTCPYDVWIGNMMMTYQPECSVQKLISWQYGYYDGGEVGRVGGTSVTRFGDLLDFGQLFKVFGNN